MGADAGRNEAGLLQGVTINDKHAIGTNVGDEERSPVRSRAYILWHAAFRQLQIAKHLPIYRINLRNVTVELARKERIATVDGVVGVVDASATRRLQQGLEGHCMRIAEVQPL